MGLYPNVDLGCLPIGVGSISPSVLFERSIPLLLSLSELYAHRSSRVLSEPLRTNQHHLQHASGPGAEARKASSIVITPQRYAGTHLSVRMVGYVMSDRQGPACIGRVRFLPAHRRYLPTASFVSQDCKNAVQSLRPDNTCGGLADLLQCSPIRPPIKKTYVLRRW